MPQNYYVYCIVGVVLLGTAVRALFTGRISSKGANSKHNRWGRQFYSREKTPGMYWFSVIGCFAGGILAFVLPFIMKAQ